MSRRAAHSSAPEPVDESASNRHGSDPTSGHGQQQPTEQAGAHAQRFLRERHMGCPAARENAERKEKRGNGKARLKRCRLGIGGGEMSASSVAGPHTAEMNPDTQYAKSAGVS